MFNKNIIFPHAQNSKNNNLAIPLGTAIEQEHPLRHVFGLSLFGGSISPGAATWNAETWYSKWLQ